MRKRKKLFPFLVGLVFTLGLVLGSSFCAFADSQSDKLMKVIPPKGWKKTSSVSEVYSNAVGSTVILAKSGIPDKANTPDKFMAMMKKETLTIYPNAKFKTIQKLKVAGKPARSLPYSVKVGPLDMQYYILYIFDGDYAHIMTCSAIKSNYTASEKDFQKFIKSVKL